VLTIVDFRMSLFAKNGIIVQFAKEDGLICSKMGFIEFFNQENSFMHQDHVARVIFLYRMGSSYNLSVSQLRSVSHNSRGVNNTKRQYVLNILSFFLVLQEH